MIDLKRYGSVWDRKERINQNDNLDTIEKIINDRGVGILSVSAFLTWLDENGIKHREEVATFADLPENDSLNTVRGVSDSNKIYIKKENGWVPFQTIDISKINRVESKVDDLAVNVKFFGAIGDGITDDTKSLTDAKNYINDNGGIFYIPESYVCKFSGDLDLFGIKHIKIDGELKGDGTNTVIMGLRSQNPAPTTFIINRVIDSTLEFRGIKNANGDIKYAQHLRFFADASQDLIGSIAYNIFTLGKIDLFEIYGVSGGWINENKFFGGRIRDLNINSSDSSYGHNHNIFYAPNLEGSDVFINGGSNIIYDARLEGSNTITFGNNSSNNIIEKSWTNERSSYMQGQEKSVVDNYVTDNGYYNRVVHMQDRYTMKDNVFNLNPDSGNYNLSHIQKNSEDLTVLFDGIYDDVYNSGLVPFNDDFGFELESNADLWWVVVEMYDINKELIESITTAEEVFSSTTMNHSTQFPGTLRAARANKELRFSANNHPDVHYIKVSVYPAKQGIFNHLNIYLRKPIDSTQELPLLNKFKMYSTNTYSPTGDHSIGTVAYHTDPTDSLGVVMTSEGWKKFGSII